MAFLISSSYAPSVVSPPQKCIIGILNIVATRATLNISYRSPNTINPSNLLFPK